MLPDVRLALRMLVDAKGWTAIVVVSLALGIGANTALFSAMNGLLLRTLPVANPDTLVRFRYAGADQARTDVLIYGYSAPDHRGRPVEPTFSYPMYRQLRDDNQTLSDLVACAPFGIVNVIVDGQADIANAFLSSGNYYAVLGVTARIGRTIVPDDDRPGTAPVAIISHKYWQTRFGGSTSVVGAAVAVNNVPVTIVGVLPSEFTGVQRAVDDPPDISLPISLEPRLVQSVVGSRLAQSNFWWVQVMGRLKPGVTIPQVQANLGGVFQRTAVASFDAYLSALSPQERARLNRADRTGAPELLLDSGSGGIYDANTTDVRAVTVLGAVVALVLLLVCANVANLLLSRATARQRELSVRLALGATRFRLVRQLLVESLLLAGIGGALGIIVGRWGQSLLPGAIGLPAPLDWRVLAFVLGVTTATGIVFGIAPALRGSRTDLNLSLKANSRSIASSRTRFGRSLVVAQVAISIVLLVGAGLFLQTLQNLRQVDLGFNARNVALFQITPGLNRYDTQKQNQLYERIGDRLQRIAGVRSVAWSNPRLMSARRFSTSFFIEGRTYAVGQRDTISVASVSPTFFETMEMPIVAGRGFTPRDTDDGPAVVVINEAAVRRYFPNESPVGRYIGSSRDRRNRREIVGIVRDAKYNDVRGAAVPTGYSPFLQGAQVTANFEVRTTGDPLAAMPAIRAAVREIDSNVPLLNVTTQEAEVEGRFLQEKVFAQAYALFGALAVIVAAVGLFGLMSYNVARRTNEIGIRMALGARRTDVLRLVMNESMMLVAGGAAIGLAGAAAAGRLIANLLFSVEPTDPMTMAGATVTMAAVAALAGYLPARRASRIDPMIALHDE